MYIYFELRRLREMLLIQKLNNKDFRFLMFILDKFCNHCLQNFKSPIAIAKIQKRMMHPFT
jgi:hypothetical protein